MFDNFLTGDDPTSQVLRARYLAAGGLEGLVFKWFLAIIRGKTLRASTKARDEDELRRLAVKFADNYIVNFKLLKVVFESADHCECFQRLYGKSPILRDRRVTFRHFLDRVRARANNASYRFKDANHAYSYAWSSASSLITDEARETLPDQHRPATATTRPDTKGVRASTLRECHEVYGEVVPGAVKFVAPPHQEREFFVVFSRGVTEALMEVDRDSSCTSGRKVKRKKKIDWGLLLARLLENPYKLLASKSSTDSSLRLRHKKMLDSILKSEPIARFVKLHESELKRWDAQELKALSGYWARYARLVWAVGQKNRGR